MTAVEVVAVAMAGVEPLPLAVSVSEAKISRNSQSRQMFSACYSMRSYKYIDIYNRYSDSYSLNCPAKIISPRCILQIISVNVRD